MPESYFNAEHQEYLSDRRRATERTQINRWANRALENVQGGWYALAEHQLLLIIEATGGRDDTTAAPTGAM